MDNEILRELWRSKDDVVRESGNDIDELVRSLQEKEAKAEVKAVDLSKKGRKAA